MKSAREYTSSEDSARSTPSSRKRSSETYASKASTRMPKPSARCATSCPIRPKPSTPSVLSYSSTPLNSERSQAPPVSDPCACGTLRASASRSASVCSAAVITFDCGALATTTPRFVAASTSTLSTPTPARPTAFSRSALASSAASSFVAERIRMPSNSPIRRSSSSWSQSRPSSTSSPASRRSCDARLADLLPYEDLHACSATPASAKTRWAAATPAPGSASCPSSRSVISRAEMVTMMSKAPK